jgi:alpha-ketoglutarate-dependent taurine dioxygenase
MSDPQSERPSIPKRDSARRKAVSVSQEALVTTALLQPDRDLPLVIQPAARGVDLMTWAASNREYVETLLVQHGALLFRGFHLSELEQFEQFVRAVSGEPLEYRFRASPRSQVSGNIYTSTDYPAEYSIFPHNEHSYSPVFPVKLFFFCVTPPQQGGETPIGSTRGIMRRIDPAVRERFIQKKILYVRNYGDGFGLPWQTVFQTEDRADVEDYCRAQGITFEWKEGNRLMTSQVGPAVVKHPRTGESVWFNHATFFHISTLAPPIRDGLLATFQERDLPNNTYYGDGSSIEPDVLEDLRRAYLDEMVSTPWQLGDILMLDNMLAVHGRASYAGPRKIVVAMAEALSSREVSQDRG